jgi:hypothetical protein
MSAASLALQTALYGALAADADVQALLGTPPRIYDAVPRNAAMPYLVLGDDRETDAGTVTGRGSVHRFTVHIWSRTPGHSEAKTIAAAVIAALDAAALSPSGFTLTGPYFLGADYARRNDGRTWHATLSFRALLEQEITPPSP